MLGDILYLFVSLLRKFLLFFIIVCSHKFWSYILQCVTIIGLVGGVCIVVAVCLVLDCCWVYLCWVGEGMLLLGASLVFYGGRLFGNCIYMLGYLVRYVKLDVLRGVWGKGLGKG